MRGEALLACAGLPTALSLAGATPPAGAEAPEGCSEAARSSAPEPFRPAGHDGGAAGLQGSPFTKAANASA